MKIEEYMLDFGISEPVYIPGKKDLSHWHISRAQRAIPNLTLFYTLKAFNRYLIGNKNDKTIEKEIRDYLVRRGAMTLLRKDAKPNPGSVRTIEAEYITFGLIYRDREGLFQFTQAGQEMVKLDHKKKFDSKKMNKIIDTLLSRLTFNNEHYHNRVKIDRNFKLRPFNFIIKLIQDERLLTLTQKDMCIPYSIAKTIEDYELVVEKILQFRQIKNLQDVLGHPIKDSLKNQSFLQILGSRGILKKEKTGYVLNQNYPNLKLFEEHSEEYLTVQKHGRWGVASAKFDNDILRGVLKDIAKNCSTIPQIYAEIERFPSKRQKKFKSLLSGMVPELEGIIENEIIVDFRSPKRCLDAERKLVDFLNGVFSDETFPTGKIVHRKKRGGHSDCLTVFRNLKCCGIFDSKANSKGKYELPSPDSRAMEDYIGEYKDLLDQLNIKFQAEIPEDTTLSFACFVSSGFSPSIEKNLSLLKESSGIPVCAIKISDLLTVADQKITPGHFLNVMTKGGVITPNSFKVIT